MGILKIKNLKQNIFAVVAAMIWGFAFSSQSACIALGMKAFTFTALRSWIAVIVLAIIALIFVRRKITKEYLKRALFGGVCCGCFLFVAQVLQQFGLEGTDSGKGGFLTALYIIMVPILSIFLKKKTSKLIWISAIIAVIGMFLLCVDITQSFSVNVYDLILVACAIVFAGHILCIDHFEDVNGIHLSLIQMAVVAVICSILAIIFETLTLECFKACFWNIMYMGVFSSGVAYTLQVLAQKGSNPTVISMLLCLESVFALLGGAIFLNEVLLPQEYIGCAIMLVAVVLAQLPQKEKK